MKFDFNASIIGPDNRGSSVDSCGGIWHIGRHYERRVESNWKTSVGAAPTAPLGFSSSLFSINTQTTANVWEQHTVDISAYANTTSRIVFWYVAGNSFTGDIQIDDIAVDGTTYTFESSAENFICNSSPLTVGTLVTSYPGTMTTNALSTSLSNGLWSRDLGGTSSLDTGSTVDHTLGTTSGYYVYAETSDNASIFSRPYFLATPSIALSGSPGNMTFWTSRYGATIGTLEVYVYVES